MLLHRRVFFIAGFDPKSPRYYHHLYRTLAAHRPPGAEGADGPPVQVGPRRRLNDIADEWEVHWPQPDGSTRHTRYTLLRWDDIVRAHWARPAKTVLLDHWRFYADGWRQGFLPLAWRLSRLNWLFLMFPLCVALLVVVAWLAGAFGLGALLPRGQHLIGGPLAALATAPLAWWGWRRLSHRIGSDWLMRLYGFSYLQAAGRIAALEGRAAAMGGMIREACVGADAADGPAEVLVVGHSTGATLAAAALAQALAPAPTLGSAGPALGLLTLGHCTPLVYGFPHAEGLRRQLAMVTADPALCWVDYTAPADWAGCGRIPPWPQRGAALLRRLSPRFPKILAPDRYAALRRDRLAMHMQYLKPADHAGRYDLLALTAGERTLRERHATARDDYEDSNA